MSEWKIEPDLLEFEIHGYTCKIRRVPQLGHLCGYVHLKFGALTEDLEDKIDIHGGLTYNQMEEKDWVIGFDCAHWGDLHPPIPAFPRTEFPGATYKTVGYVLDQLVKLVDQVKEEKEC